MQIVMNRGKWRLRTEKRRQIWFGRFYQYLLIPFDLSRLRQIVISLVTRLLTEGLLEVIS
jgi:hypothetical protein